MEKRKTIFISIYDGDSEKNILQSSVFPTLLASGARIVLLLKHGLGPSYTQYASDQVEVVQLPPSACFSEQFFYWLGWNILPTRSNYLRRQQSYKLHKNWFRFKFGAVLNWIGKFYWFRALLRAVYLRIPDDFGEELFEKYKPDLFFAPSMFSSDDGRLLRMAKKKGVRTVTTSKSWDVLTNKSFTRIMADKILVQNTIIRDVAIRIGDYPPERVETVGFVQFDFVTNKSLILSREDFCASIGADSTKKLILYSTSGDWKNPYDDEVVESIHSAIVDKTIPHPAQIIARFHPKYSSKVEKLRLPHLIQYRPCGGVEQVESIDSSDSRVYPFTFGKDDFVVLANMLYHSDVTINTMSSITLDAIAFDKPVILICHDGYDRKLPYLDSLRRLYDEDHYEIIMKTPCVRASYSVTETIDAVNAYLENPSLEAEGRAYIREKALYKLDGHSGERIAHAVLAHLPT